MASDIIRSGVCQCGCGGPTTRIAMTNRKVGHVRGEFHRYIRGHRAKRWDAPFVVEDRGYATPCHIWQYSRRPDGYGQFSDGSGRPKRAHVASYEEKHGPVPEGKELDHLCRQRDCVNADHLELVTSAENTRRGAQSRLTWDLVREIRAHPEISAVEFAYRFRVHRNAIHNVRSGYTWSDHPRLRNNN